MEREHNEYDMWSQVDGEAENMFTGPAVTIPELVDCDSLEAWLRGGADRREDSSDPTDRKSVVSDESFI